MSQDSNFNYDNTTLDNGLRVVTGRLPYTNAVSVNLLFGAGSRYESDAQLFGRVLQSFAETHEPINDEAKPTYPFQGKSQQG